MADDMSSKIKDALSNPELMSLVSSLAGQNSETQADETAIIPQESRSDDLTASIGNIINKMNNSSDRRINLLNALRPYMRESKVANIDKAVKMLRLTQLTSVFKDL